MADELYHWKSKKKKPTFKYVAKIEKGKNTRYFYSKAEWLAYLNGSKTSQNEPTTVNKSSNLVGDGKKRLSSLFNKLVTESKKSETIKTMKRSVDEAVDKGQKFVSSAVSTISNKIDGEDTDKQAKNGRNYLADKSNEEVNALFILPTDFVVDVIDTIKDAFTNSDEKAEEAKDSADDIKAPLIAEEDIPEWAEELELKEDEITHAEDQALINPEYSPYEEEYSMNCAYCTAAYDLRMRGYDVEAMPYDPNTYDANMETISEWYEDTSVEDWTYNSWVMSDPDTGAVTFMNPSEVFERTETVFEDMPDGSYGQYCVYWDMGGGHSMTWEKQNGQTIIRDCQTNQTYTYDEWVKEYADYTSSTAILRTDNREPSEKILETVRNRMEDD